MTENVAVERVGFAGPPGPEMLRIPAEPARLDQAAQQLGDLADQLEKSGEHLSGADGRHEDRKGHTTSALLHVAQWNGRTLVKDAGLLRELGEAVRHQGQLVRDLQAHDLPGLRRRWSQAQDQLVSELQQVQAQSQAQSQAHAQEAQQAQEQNQNQHHGQGAQQVHHGGPDGPRREAHGQAFVAAQAVGQPADRPAHQPDLPNAHTLLGQLDEGLVAPYADLFRGLHGRHVSVGGGHGQSGAALVDTRTEHAISSYRRSVSSVLEEFAGLVHRIEQSERRVEEKVQRPEVDREETGTAGATLVSSGDMVSGVAALRHLVQDLRDGSKAADQAHDRMAGISRTLQDGLLPGRDGEERDNLRSEWEQHFSRRTERLRTVCSKVDDVLEKFSRLDAECAAAIRAH